MGPAQPLGLPPPCPWPSTLFQPPRAIRPCPSATAAGLVSRTPHPCPAQPWVPPSQDHPQANSLALPCPCPCPQGGAQCLRWGCSGVPSSCPAPGWGSWLLPSCPRGAPMALGCPALRETASHAAPWQVP